MMIVSNLLLYKLKTSFMSYTFSVANSFSFDFLLKF